MSADGSASTRSSAKEHTSVALAYVASLLVSKVPHRSTEIPASDRGGDDADSHRHPTGSTTAPSTGRSLRMSGASVTRSCSDGRGGAGSIDRSVAAPVAAWSRLPGHSLHHECRTAQPCGCGTDCLRATGVVCARRHRGVGRPQLLRGARRWALYDAAYRVPDGAGARRTRRRWRPAASAARVAHGGPEPIDDLAMEKGRKAGVGYERIHRPDPVELTCRDGRPSPSGSRTRLPGSEVRPSRVLTGGTEKASVRQAVRKHIRRGAEEAVIQGMRATITRGPPR